MKSKFIITAALLCVTLFVPLSLFGQEAVIGNEKIAGSWYYTEENIAVLIQYSLSGQGREIIVDQSSGFSLMFFPFEYTLTATTIRQVILLQGRRIENPLRYGMLSDMLVLHNYTEGFSPFFQKQHSYEVEGIWQRTDDSGDIIEYIFTGGVLIKVQNGQPFAFGMLEVSGATLILTEQYRFVDLAGVQRWIRSTVPQERCQYRLEGNTLSWTSNNGQVSFVRR